MSYLKVVAIGAFAGAVLVAVVNAMADREMDSHIYATISSALDFHDRSPLTSSLGE